MIVLKERDEIELHIRAEGPGGVIGDVVHITRPGGKAWGETYEKPLAHGDGEIDRD